MDRVFLDTNIFLRIFGEGSIQQTEESAVLLKQIQIGNVQAYTSTLVLAELGWTLKSYYKTEKEVIIEALQIHAIENLKIIDNYDHALALQLYSQYNIKLIDCFIASIPDIFKANITLISFDTDFDKIPSVKRREPADISSGLV